MNRATRIAIFELLSTPAFLWLRVCAWVTNVELNCGPPDRNSGKQD